MGQPPVPESHGWFTIVLTASDTMNIGNAVHISGLIFGVMAVYAFVLKKYRALMTMSP
ncbi:hypothetical protein [Desulfatibacillum aliphaticivorans]|uniref:hypothetical protein n=1 Tax=Desulfatibacillum aliphaticivorans TaxID=218208 RepID=UPI0014725D90|nr:hypothetical protein [Desulfatibacillum aliphaticivorans]